LFVCVHVCLFYLKTTKEWICETSELLWNFLRVCFKNTSTFMFVCSIHVCLVLFYLCMFILHVFIYVFRVCLIDVWFYFIVCIHFIFIHVCLCLFMFVCFFYLLHFCLMYNPKVHLIYKNNLPCSCVEKT